MRWLRPILFMFVGLLILVVAGLAYLWNHPQPLREPVTRLVSNLIGRQLKIDGDFDVIPGRILSLRATDLRIANPDWVDEGDFLQVAEAEATIDLTTIFNGPLILPTVSVRSAELSLLQDTERRNNWTFGEGSEPADTADTSEDPGPAFLIRKIDLADGHINVRLPTLADPIRLDIDSLAQRPRDDGLLDAKLVGSLNKKPVQVEGQLGPFASLVTLSDVQLDLDGRFDTLSLTARGSVDDLANPRAPSLVFSLAGPDVRDLAEMLGLGRAGEGDIDLAGNLRPTDNGLIGTIRGQMGRSRIDVSAQTAELFSFENAGISIDIEAPNLGRFLALLGIDGVPEEPYGLRGRVERTGSLLTISDLELSLADARFALAGTVEQFPDLDGARLQLDVRGDDIARFRELLRLPGIASGAFEMTGEIDVSQEGTELLDIEFATNLFDVRLSGSIGDPPGYLGTRLKLDARGDNFRELAEALEVRDQRAVTFELTGEIEVTERGFETLDNTVLRLGDQRLALDGLIGLEPLAADTDLRFRLYGNSTDALAELVDVERFSADNAYDARGRFRAQRKGFLLDDIDGRIGDAEFSVAGLITRDAQLIGSELRISASGPNLEGVLADTPGFDVPPNPFRVSGKLARRRNSIEISSLQAEGGRGRLTADLDIGWPLDTASSGKFAVTAEGPDLAAVFPELEVYQPDAVEFAARAEGSWNAGVWNIRNFAANLDAASITARGTVDQPPDMVRTDLDIELTVPDLSRLGEVRGERLPATPFDLAVHFVNDSARYVLEEIDGRLGDGSFDGSIIVDPGGNIPDVELLLRSGLLDLRPFLPSPDEVSARQETATAPTSDGRIIPDTPLPLAALGKLNLRADVTADQVRLHTVTLSDLVIDGSLRDGALALDEARVRGPLGGSLQISGGLVPGDGGAEASASIKGEQIRLNLFTETRDDVEQQPVTDFSLALSARGNDLRQLAASLDGNARFEARGGRIPNSGLQLLTGDFLLQVLRTLNPFVREEPFTGISCIAVLLEADDGKVLTAPAAVVQTDKLNIFIDGRFDLDSESQNWTFRSSPRKGITISISEVLNPFFMVTGTFSKPSLTLDPAGVTVRGAAAVLTAGLSIIARAAWDRAFRAADPCAAAIERADKLIEARP